MDRVAEPVEDDGSAELVIVPALEKCSGSTSKLWVLLVDPRSKH